MKKTKRNLGVELLRLVTMMTIVLGHCLDHGKVAVNFSAAEFLPFSVLAVFCYTSVNVYALTTGYACIKSTHRWYRGIQLWLQVVFYALAICAAGLLLGHATSAKTILASFVPVTSNLYWYFSSYFMVFCLIPFLNKLLLGLSKRQFKKLLLVGVVLMCGISWLGDYLGFLPFSANNGFSPLWLTYLYCVGAYLRVYEADFEKRKKSTYAGIYLLCALTVFAGKYLIAFLTQSILGEVMFRRILGTYLSPIAIIGAAALFLFFANLDIKNGRFIAMLAPCSFGVYLLHDHPITRELIIKNGLSGCAQMPWYQALGCTLAFAFAVFFAGLLIDFLRSKLFALLHIPQFAKWLEEKLKVFARRLIR